MRSCILPLREPRVSQVTNHGANEGEGRAMDETVGILKLQLYSVFW